MTKQQITALPTSRLGNVVSSLIQRNTMKSRAGQSLSPLFKFPEMYFLFLLSQFDEALPLQQIM